MSYPVYQILKDSPALLIALELIEARARRRKQDRIARARAGPGFGYRAVERLRFYQPRRTRELRFDFFGRSPDQQRGAGLLLKPVPEERVIAALVLTAEDDPEIARERIQRLDGGVHAGRFRIIVKAHA